MKCAICGRDDSKRWIKHHVNYEKDITRTVFYVCHEWLHHRRVWAHPVFDKMGKDKGVLAFLRAALKLYKGAL